MPTLRGLDGGFLGGVLFVGLWLVVALGAALIVRRFANREVLKEHNDVVGFIVAVVGVVYAVLLGFVAIGAWDRFAAAEVHTYDEAAALTQVYREVTPFPQAAEVHEELRQYVKEVIDREWPLMGVGGESDDAARTIGRVASQVRDFHSSKPGSDVIHTAMLAGIDRALTDRAERLSMDENSLNESVWTTLLAGATVTIGFSLLFGFRSQVLQLLTVGGLTFSIAIIFYLTMSLAYPFQGRIHVQPRAFERALVFFDIEDRYYY